MSRHACRTDANHKQISDYFRSMGWEVKDTHRGADNCLDIRCKKPGRSTIDVEIKNPNSKSRFTESEMEFILTHDKAFVAYDLDDVEQITNHEAAARQYTLSCVIAQIERLREVKKYFGIG